MILICVILVIGSSIIYSPRPIVSSPFSFAYDIEWTRHEDGAMRGSYRFYDDNFVFISRVKHNGEDVIERFDHDALVELLAVTNARRIPLSRVGGHFVADVVWEISLIQGGDSRHILLSRENAAQELNFWYSPLGSRPIHRIVDPVALVGALEQMMAD